jgi:hypothetical protein
MSLLSDRFSAIAAASRTWVDKFMRGIVIILYRGLRFCSSANSGICRRQVRHHQRRLKQPIFSRRPQGTRTRYPLRDRMRRVAAPGLEDARERLTMPTDRVVEYDNAGIPKLFSIELLRRKRDIEGLFGHGICSIFATPRDEAMRIFAESDVTVLTDPHHRPAIPFPINSKTEEYRDDVWQHINRDRK